MGWEEKAKEFDNLHPIQKLRAIGALEQQEEENKKLNSIREEFEKSRDRIINIININDEYQIIEYEMKIEKESKRYYSIYINFKRTSTVAETLDEAIIAAIAIKYDGHSTQAPYYISKMLGMETKNRVIKS